MKLINIKLKNNVLGIFLIILCICIALAVPSFLKPMNLLNILIQISINSLLATGMTFVILTGGIDLSVGSVAALAGIASSALMLQMPNAGVVESMLVIFGISLVVGVVCGGSVGFAVSYLHVAPFIATLSMMSIARGFAYVYTKSQPVYGMPTSFSWLGNEYIGPIPALGVLTIIILVIAAVILNKYSYGRYVYAIGSNKEVAKLAGVKVKKIELSVYIISATLAALGGCALASRLATGQPAAANGYELNAIAAVAMGGTSMSGGSGGIGKTCIGLITIGVINNGLSLLQVDSYWQIISMGVIIFVAVAFDQTKNSRKAT